MRSIIPYLILILIILIQGYVLIFRNTPLEIETFDDSTLRKEIQLADSAAIYWQHMSFGWEQIATDAEKYSDSLENLKPIIQHHYHEIYKSIPDGTITQLDSIIRTNW